MSISDVAETRANDLFGSLTADVTFDLPTVDFTSVDFQYPTVEGNALYGSVEKLSQADLTTKTVDGTGMFDGLMQALKSHLKTEYDADRITGKEYADAYVAMTQAAMGNAVQYLLAKEQSYWQAQLTQMQARSAENAVVSSRIEAEISKAKLAMAQVETQTSATNYAMTKLQLATADAQYELAQRQEEKAVYELTYMMPAQLNQALKETEIADYNLTAVMPKEVLRIENQIDIGSAQISEITAKKDQTLYQTASLLPAQKLNMEADTAGKNYQVTDLLPAQKDQILEDTAGKAYTNTFILPEQLELAREQTETQRSKTLDTRTDGVTSIAGSVGKQKELYDQQITSYQRDAENKLVKVIMDAWITNQSILGEAGDPISSATSLTLASTIEDAKTKVGLT